MTEEPQTAIVVPCHEVDDRIRRWRGRAEPSGLPAHVTLLVPFKPLELITGEDLASLGALFAREPIATVRFTGTGRFPGVLYLAPADGARFLHLVEQLVDRFPSYRPYGGSFEEVVPHLTVSHDLDESALDAAERELTERLPIECRPDAAWLMTFDGEAWACEARFPFLDVQ